MRSVGWGAGLAAGLVVMALVSHGGAAPGAARFGIFVAGQALFLACGSALFIRLYARLAAGAGGRLLAAPLAEIASRRRLLVGLHVAVFGAFLAFTLLAYGMPERQQALMGLVRQQAQKTDNPLGIAAAAYRSGSVLKAAAATLAVNFLLGTLATITVPSTVVPGVGALFALLRAGLVGFALAPTSGRLFGGMALHTGTILVEMEAYILAAFFALLMPISLLDHDGESTGSERYLRAMAINAKGTVLTFAILAVAALYEATEVIMQMG